MLRAARAAGLCPPALLLLCNILLAARAHRAIDREPGISRPVLPSIRRLQDGQAPGVIFSSQGDWVPPAGAADEGGWLRFPGLLPPGEELVSAAANPQPSLLDCSRSCRRLPECNVFWRCEAQGGCSSGNLSAPLGGCQLVRQVESSPQSGRPTLAYAAPGFAGGSPVRNLPSEVPGYKAVVGQGFFLTIGAGSTPGQIFNANNTSHRSYDYSCDGSMVTNRFVCVFIGGPQDVAPRCSADSDCLAMMAFPTGREMSGSAIVSLKGGPGVTALNPQDAIFNQNAIAYYKQSSPPPPPPPNAANGSGGDAAAPSSDSSSSSSSGGNDGGGLSGGAIAGIAVGACCSAALAAACGVLLVRQRNQRQQQQRGRAGGLEASGGSGKPKSASTDDAEKGLQPHEPPADEAGGGAGVNGTGAGGPGWGSTPSLTTPFSKASRQWEKERLARAASASSTALALTSRGSVSSLEAGSGGDASLGTPKSSVPSDQLLARLPSEGWEASVVDPENLQFCQDAEGNLVELGSGSYSTVYRVLLDGVQPAAAKVLSFRSYQGLSMQQMFLKEASLLRRLRHRNIVGFMGVATDESRGIILMELMEGRDLHTRLHAKTKGNERLFGWYQRGRTVALDVARGLHYLHARNLTHFDCKSSNVLLTRDLTAKLADVGFAKTLRATHHSISGARTGTFDYMAPELLMGLNCTQAVDIYSFGILLHEICSGEFPSRGCNRELRVPEECPQAVADLYLACIEQDPALRPSSKELVQRLTQLQR